MKMELIEGSEKSAIRTQTPGNYPKENILHIEHDESLKSRIQTTIFNFCYFKLTTTSFHYSTINFKKKQYDF